MVVSTVVPPGGVPDLSRLCERILERARRSQGYFTHTPHGSDGSVVGGWTREDGTTQKTALKIEFMARYRYTFNV